MNTVFAVLLVLVGLGVTLYPLRRSVQRGAPTRAGRLRELDERYRSALADLQDVELDREIGNLVEPDYDALRSRYRVRAAQALAEIDAEVQARTRLQESLAKRANGHAVAAEVPRSESPGALSRAFLPAGLLAVAVVLGIGGLYVRQVGEQGQQDPLSVLPLAHAHAVLVAAPGDLWVAHHEGVVHSANGKSWQSVLSNGDFMSVIRWPDGRLLGLGHEAVWQSSNGGVSWAPTSHDLPGSDIHGAQLVGSRLYAYVVGLGLFETADGAQWEPRARAVTGNVYGLAALPGAPEVLFLAVDERLIRTLDGGRTWSDAAGAGNLALTGKVRTVAADVSRGSVYAGTSDGLFQSATNGAQWVKLPFKSPVMAVGVSAGRVGLVNDRNEFFLSNDGGVTWFTGA